MELIIDGDCGFCQRSARWIQRRLRSEVSVIASEQLNDDALATRSLNRADVEREVWLIGAEQSWSGSMAIAQLLKLSSRPWPFLGDVMASRALRPVARVVYRWVARHRSRLPGSTCEVSSSPMRR